MYIRNRVLVISFCVFIMAVLAGCAVSPSNTRTEVYQPVIQPGKIYSDAVNDLLNALKDNKWTEKQQAGGYAYIPIKCAIVNNKFEMRRLDDGRMLLTFYLYRLLGKHIVVEKNRLFHVSLAGLITLNFGNIDDAKKTADAFYFIQQDLGNYRDYLDRQLANFEPVAAQYRSLEIKPPILEEQRKLIVQANALTEQKQYFQAREKYRRAIELDPVFYPGAYFNLALLEAQMNLPFAAITYMKHYLLLVPDSKDARSARDKIYEWELIMPPAQNPSVSGRDSRGYLGVRVQSMTKGQGSPSGLQKGNGVRVVEVMTHSPAEQAGLERGDIILTFDGKEINEMLDLTRMVAATPIGKMIDVNIIRSSRDRTVKVKIGKLPD